MGGTCMAMTMKSSLPVLYNSANGNRKKAKKKSKKKVIRKKR